MYLPKTTAFLNERLRFVRTVTFNKEHLASLNLNKQGEWQQAEIHIISLLNEIGLEYEPNSNSREVLSMIEYRLNVFLKRHISVVRTAQEGYEHLSHLFTDSENIEFTQKSIGEINRINDCLIEVMLCFKVLNGQ